MSRKLMIVLAVPVLVVVAAMLLVPLFLDEDRLVAMAAEALEREAGATLVVDGGVKLSVFPRVSLELADVGVSMPGEQALSVTVAVMSVGLDLAPLLSGRAEVDRVIVDGLHMSLRSAPPPPTIDTSQLTNDQLDALYARRRAELNKAGEAASAEAVLAMPLALNVAQLAVSNSVLKVVSAETGEVSRVEIVRLEATGLNAEGVAIPLSGLVRIGGGEGSDTIEVQFAGDVSVDAASDELTLSKLTVEVDGALPKPVEAQLSGMVNLQQQSADLELEVSLAGGEILGEGKLRYASFESPQIDAKMHFNQFDPALLALAGPGAAAASDEPPRSEAGTPGGEPLPLDAIRAVDTKAVLTIDEVNLSGHRIKEVKLKLRAEDGLVKLFPFTGSLHGGQIKVNSTFNAQHNPAKLFTKGELVGLSIPQALEAMDAGPVLTGTADLQWRLNSRGNTDEQLVATLNGPIELSTSGVVLQEMSVEKMLCEAVALTNRESLTQPLPDQTRFENLSVKLAMKGGELQMQPLRAELPHMKLTGKGKLDLLKQNFAATFTARLSSRLGELDPACRVNKRITAIGWPVKCKGDLGGNPAGWCRVDSDKIIEDLAKKEVEHQVEKQAGKLLRKLMNN